MSVTLPGLGLYLTPQANDVGSPLIVEAMNFLIDNIPFKSHPYAVAFTQFHCPFQR